MKKLDYKPYFSFGNVVTILGGVVCMFGIVSALQTGQASAESEREAMKERITKLEIAMEQVGKVREDMIRVSVNQENLMKQNDNILEFLKEKTKVRN